MAVLLPEPLEAVDAAAALALVLAGLVRLGRRRRRRRRRRFAWPIKRRQSQIRLLRVSLELIHLCYLAKPTLAPSP